MSSLLWGAALKALGDGGQVATQSMARSDELDRRLQAEAEIKRERMQLDRDIAGMRYGDSVGAGSAGGSRSSGKGGNVFGFKSVDEAAAAGVGIRPEDIPALEAGTYGEKVTPLQGPVDEAGNGPGEIRSSTPDLKALNAAKLGELNALRKTLVVGGDVKDMSKARLDDQERTLVDQFNAGDTRSGEAAALAKKGSIYSADQTGVTNNVTGANTPTKVGEATVKERQAGANKDNALAGKAVVETKVIKSEDSAGARATTVQSVISGESGEAVAVMRDGSTKPLGIKSAAFNKQVSDIVTKIAESDGKFRRLPIEEQRAIAVKQLTGGDPVAKPSAKPASSNAPYAEGTRLVGPGGKPFIVKNGVPVPAK
jgi:hypothetical protein